MNTSLATLGIPLNFCKAFDTIDHLTLIQKLYKMNFSVEALKLIQSYILEQQQYVQIDDKTSSTKLNKFGVPQCSILGPVLFNLYIVEIIDNVSCNSLRYDDTTLYRHCKLKNIQNCIEKLESDLKTASDWVLQNSLVFNDDKTKYLLFSSIQLSTRHNLNQPDKCKLIHNNEPVEQMNSTKILAIHFDENLAWITHVNNLIKSFHATLRSLRQFKRFTPCKI